ncbi:MAG: DNA polymerase III subunit gamma/tau, partial [Phascolarctobacterium sp.]|nr:DNA polymerase III subunit gamma/tau [Phascolarctobacterium sp.]
MAYETLYRRFRPQDFDFLVGQGPVKTALKNAIASGRISHAYLFSGPRGTGKTSTARILAKALCCDEGPTPHPCGKCGNCEKITLGTSMDVFEIDAASNRGIEEIKALREQLAFAPVEARYKVYIIDEVHMMTPEAFNALLKTLEEPPAHVIFILATTDAHKIPATIHSRCQRFDFRRMTVGEITGHLKKVAEESGIDAEDEALRLMAIQAEGGLRDALSLLEQCSVVDKNVTAESVRATLGIVGCEVMRAIAENIGKNNLPEVLMDLNRLFEEGKEAGQILAELAGYMRAVLLYKTTPEFDEIYLTDTAENFAEVAGLFSNARIIEAQEKIHSALKELKDAMRTRITTELCFFDLCRDEGTLADFAARVERLEEQLAVGLPVKPAGRESAE